MKASTFLLGAAAGAALAWALTTESACCRIVSDAARDKIGDKFGATGTAIYDLVGARKWLPGFLGGIGYTP